jgi:hypothetical protein
MQTHISAAADKQFTKLSAFRQAAYAGLGPARAALFELADAVYAGKEQKSSIAEYWTLHNVVPEGIRTYPLHQMPGELAQGDAVSYEGLAMRLSCMLHRNDDSLRLYLFPTYL